MVWSLCGVMGAGIFLQGMVLELIFHFLEGIFPFWVRLSWRGWSGLGPPLLQGEQGAPSHPCLPFLPSASFQGTFLAGPSVWRARAGRKCQDSGLFPSPLESTKTQLSWPLASHMKTFHRFDSGSGAVGRAELCNFVPKAFWGVWKKTVFMSTLFCCRRWVYWSSYVFMMSITPPASWGLSSSLWYHWRIWEETLVFSGSPLDSGRRGTVRIVECATSVIAREILSMHPILFYFSI